MTRPLALTIRALGDDAHTPIAELASTVDLLYERSESVHERSSS